MTIHADVEWEIRTTGAGTNGGGFYDKNPGTSVDYSQQASAQLALTDIASDGAGTGVSSATGGFTAAMEGNAIFVTGGTGFTEGWYVITGYTDTNNITIDRSAGASKTGGTGNVGGAWTLSNVTRDALFFDGTNKGDFNTVWWQKGTYVISYNLTIAANYLHVFGYDSTRGDNPEGTNRPYVDLGSGSHYYIWFNSSSNFLILMNFSVSSRDSASSTATLLIYGDFSLLVNVKAERNNFDAPAFAIGADYITLMQCHAVADTGDGFLISGSKDHVTFQYCYADVAQVGFDISGTSWGTIIENCIAGNCVDGFRTSFHGRVHNCTVYACTGYGIYSSYGGTFINNIIEACGTGIYGNSITVAANNCLYNNTTDYDNFQSHGYGDVLSDPLMVDPSNGDFTLDAGSPCFNAGLKLGAAVGL